MKQALCKRLVDADPGWPVWAELIRLVSSLEFESVSLEGLGQYVASGTRLSFGVPGEMPAFIPPYVVALFGMSSDDPEMAGGFADAFDGAVAERGSLFSPAGNDSEMGCPVFDPPSETYPFQSNSSGAVFFLNRALEIVIPNPETFQFDRLDSLDDFAKSCIQSAVDNKDWFEAYSNRCRDLLD
ncbi:MAG: hypothetical protein AAFX06_14510 [Planctomycetota bacterium]